MALGTVPMIAAVALPRNAEVIEQLELLADMLELEGTEAFRVLAYRRAAQRIGEAGGSIAQLARVHNRTQFAVEAQLERQGLWDRAERRPTTPGDSRFGRDVAVQAK